MKSNVYEVYVKFFILISLIFLSLQTKLRLDRNENFVLRLNEKKIKSFFKNYRMNKDDSMSFSQENGIVQQHLDFEVDIDMEKKILEGLVRINFKCLGSTNFAAFDISDLSIINVKDSQSNLLKYYIIKNNKSSIGNGLIVKLSKNCSQGETSFLEIYYSTTRNSLGLHFSDPNVLHHKDKKYSFLYTHGEAIYSRTFFPSQDSPSLKVTSTAMLRIKEPYTALFSGEFVAKKKLNNGLLEYSYKMDKPIATYLITFAAGVIEKKQIKDSRCEVWGEAEAMKWVDESFKNCEDYLKFYETYKPFSFNKMTFLVVPDDFPFSGMENPYVTFISEAVLAKDRSYTNTIAHEIVHFWSGNLVTNKNWVSFWLNEGITTYLNRKAFRVLHGDDEFFFELYNGLFKLDLALKDLRVNKHLDASFRSLTPKITDDPYMTFSRIPYEKGSFFMYHIETIVGDSVMHKILSDYFNEFQFKSLHSEEFIKFLKEKIQLYHPEGNKKIQEINWTEWLYGTENLPVDFSIDSKNVKDFKIKVEEYKKAEKSEDELKTMFKNMKISEKDRVLKELSESYKKLSDKALSTIESFIGDDSLFEDHVNIKASHIILKAHFIKDNMDRENFILESLETLKFYKVQHLRKIFGLLKEINPDKNYLGKILSNFKNRLNPITVNRINEYIEQNK
jgi:leukotriene-A4 hydrolase